MSSVTLDATAILENGVVTVGGTTFDVGISDTHTVTINWGDGSPNSVISLAAGTRGFSDIAHTYADDNDLDLYTIVVSVSDGAATSQAFAQSLTVTNVAPTAAISNSGSVNEGQAATVSFSNQFDPSVSDTNTGLRYFFSTSSAARDSATYSEASTSASQSFNFSDNGSHIIYGRHPSTRMADSPTTKPRSSLTISLPPRHSTAQRPPTKRIGYL